MEPTSPSPTSITSRERACRRTSGRSARPGPEIDHYALYRPGEPSILFIGDLVTPPRPRRARSCCRPDAPRLAPGHRAAEPREAARPRGRGPALPVARRLHRRGSERRPRRPLRAHRMTSPYWLEEPLEERPGRRAGRPRGRGGRRRRSDRLRVRPRARRGGPEGAAPRRAAGRLGRERPERRVRATRRGRSVRRERRGDRTRARRTLLALRPSEALDRMEALAGDALVAHRAACGSRPTRKSATGCAPSTSSCDEDGFAVEWRESARRIRSMRPSSPRSSIRSTPRSSRPGGRDGWPRSPPTAGVDIREGSRVDVGRRARREHRSSSRPTATRAACSDRSRG